MRVVIDIELERFVLRLHCKQLIRSPVRLNLKTRLEEKLERCKYQRYAMIVEKKIILLPRKCRVPVRQIFSIVATKEKE
jgi:hypothetical protein